MEKMNFERMLQEQIKKLADERKAKRRTEPERAQLLPHIEQEQLRRMIADIIQNEEHGQRWATRK